MQRALDRMIAPQPRPTRHGLAHGAWIAARPALSRKATTHLSIRAREERGHLAWGHDVIKLRNHEPRGADPIEHFRETVRIPGIVITSSNPS